MDNIPENSGKQKIETITEETINFIDGQEDDHVEQLHEENAEVDGGTAGETTGAAGASEETAGAVGTPGETTETEQALGEAIEAAVALGEAIGAAGASEEATGASGAPQLSELPRVEGLPYSPLDELSLRVSEPGAAQTAPAEPQRTPDALYTSYDEGLGLTAAGGHDLTSVDLLHPGDLSTSSYSIAETTMIDSSSLLRMASAPMRSRQFESSMEKTNEELNSFKRRIDANTEEQREHADLMADLQRKIEDYRRRIAAIENQQIVSKPEESITFNIKEATGPEDIFGSDFKMTQEVGLDTSSVMLEEERRRNNELRLQIARQKMELDMLRQQFEMNIRDKDKAFQMREQNLAQYLSEEQQKMLSLWDELQRIRAEFAQYREETERDLESQRNEFVRVSKGVGGIVRKLSLNAFNVVDGGGKDTELIEALKRFQEQIASPRDQSKVSDEHDTLMKKYEQAIERIVELESHDDGSSARLTLLEAELKRTKQKLSDSQNALRIVHNMAKEAEAKSGQKRRPRSLSPSPTALQPNEVVRSVRCTLRGYEGDLQQLQRNFKNSELQLEELSRRYENVEDMRKRLEKQLADTKKELLISENSLDDANREVNRLEDKLNVSESENAFAEGVRSKLEDEIRRLKITLEQADIAGLRKALEDCEAEKKLVEEDYKIRVAELSRRMDLFQEENKKLKGDLLEMKSKHRELEMEYNGTIRKINEKDVTIQNLELLKTNLLKELENERVRFDAVTSELDNLQVDFDSKTKTTVAVEMTVKELKRQRDEISKEKEDLSKHLVELSRRLASEIKRGDDAEYIMQQNMNDIGRMEGDLLDNEKQILALRQQNDESDTKLATLNAKISNLENCQASSAREIQKLTELNAKLQQEKQDIMSLKQKCDVMVDLLKDKLRKMDVEMEKLKGENRELQEREDAAQKQQKEDANKVHQLAMELKEAGAEIQELERKLAQVAEDDQLRLQQTRQASSDQVTHLEVTEITETKVKQLGDKHKLEIEKLENDKDELTHRLREMEDELDEREHQLDARKSELNELKLNLEREMERFRLERSDLIGKHQNEMEEEREHHSRELEALKAKEDDLLSKIIFLEKRIEDLQDHEGTLRAELKDWQEKHAVTHKELQTVRDQLENEHRDSEKEIQKWKTELYTVQMELKNFEAANETQKSQLAIASERGAALNKTVTEQSGRIRELNAQVRRLEESLSDVNSTLLSKETDLEDTVRQLKSAQDQFLNLQSGYNKLLAENDALKRKMDILNNTTTSNDSEIERLKKKLSQVAALNKEHEMQLEKLRTERDEMERTCRERAKSIEQLENTNEGLEGKLERITQELQILKDKLLVSESENSSLHSQFSKLEQEVQFGKEVLQRKTNEFGIALQDLSLAHRNAEEERVLALQDVETKKFEIADLESRLENSEQRLNAIQQEYLKVDKERDLLNDSLRRLQVALSRTCVPETGDGALDVQAIDVHVQKLIARIEKLERERNQYRDSFDRLQRKTSDSHIVLSKQEHLYKSVEEKMIDMEEEKRAVEVKLTSAKELLRSQEEALKKREEERSALKQKLIANELETRGKEAQIRHLNERVKNLRGELENCQNENRQLKEKEEQMDVNKIVLESKIRDYDSETQKINVLMENFETERQKLNESVKKLASELMTSQSENSDLKDDLERAKKELAKFERSEVNLRRSLDEQMRNVKECQNLRDRLVVTQNDLSNAQSRKQQLESDLIAVRGELRDAKQFQRDLAARVGEFERQIQMQTAEKNRLVDRVADLEKVIAAERAVSVELRQKYLAAEGEQKTIQNELDELKRRLMEMETSRVKLLERVADLKNIRVTLTKKIDLLEAEKRSAETMINETALQREAIERSLTALERENKELYRNCSRLQQQVAQLEMDNGTRLIAMSNRQKEEHEKFVQAIKAEKVQVERIVENRDRIQKTRIKQLENQLNALRELLTNERLRSRRDDGDKLLMMSDFGGKIAGGYGSILAGISGHGASSVGVASSDFGGTLPYGGSALGATTGLGLGGVGLGLGLGLGAGSEPPIDLGPVRLVGGATRPGAATLTSATAFDYAAFSDVGGSKLASRQMTSSQARSISPIREHPSPPADMSSLKETETVTKPTDSNGEEIKLSKDDELKSQASSSSGSSEGREQKTTIVVHMKGATTPPPTATKHDSSEHSYSD